MKENISIWYMSNTHSLFLDSEGIVERIFRSIGDDKKIVFLPKSKINPTRKEEVEYIVTV